MAENKNTPAVIPKKIELPKLDELHHDSEEAFKYDQLKYILNQPPNAKWLKDHPSATKKVVTTLPDGKKETRTVPCQYLPIDKEEFLLDRIFQKFRIEVLREGILANSVYCTVRVHYKDPITGEWDFHDGVGANPIQIKSGSSGPLDFVNMNPMAIQMGLPAAKSYAIKDACDHLGKLFGRDVNRADTIDFSGSYSAAGGKPKPEDKSDERLEKLIVAATTREELKKYKEHVTTDFQRNMYDELWKKLK